MWAVAAQPRAGLTPMIPTPSVDSGIARADVGGWRRCVARGDGVGERREAPGDGLGRHVQDVLGVALAVARAVEAAGENLVVGDDRLRVHVVVDGALSVGRRALAGKT